MTMKEKITLAELQEILLWQSLNKQLISLKAKGTVIKKNDHHALQSFCFQNKLFATITDASILDETPIALISDFKALAFLTVNIPQWKNVLARLMPKACILDCTRALADAFDTLTKYDKKYNLTKEAGISESDDEELYDFINQYSAFRAEKRIPDFSEVINETHRLKGVALKKMISKINNEKLTKIENEIFIIDLCVLKEGGKAFHLYKKLKEVYVEEYLRKAENYIVRENNVLQRANQKHILSFLEGKLGQKGLKRSIGDFIRYELPLYKTEINLTNKFLRDIRQKIDANDYTTIDICNERSFLFLKQPLPLV